MVNRLGGGQSPQSGNAFTQASAKYLETKFTNFDQIKSLQQLDFSFDGKRQFFRN